MDDLYLMRFVSSPCSCSFKLLSSAKMSANYATCGVIAASSFARNESTDCKNLTTVLMSEKMQFPLEGHRTSV